MKIERIILMVELFKTVAGDGRQAARTQKLRFALRS